jgi:hypothetical protein
MKKPPHEYNFNSFPGSLKINEKYITENTFTSLLHSLNHEGDTKTKKRRKIVGVFHH